MHTQIMQICPTCLHIIKLKIRLCLMFPRALMMYVVCSFVCLCGCAFTRKWHPVEADWSTAGVLWLCYLSTVILHEQTFYTHKPHTHTHKSTDTHTHTHTQPINTSISLWYAAIRLGIFNQTWVFTAPAPHPFISPISHTQTHTYIQIHTVSTGIMRATSLATSN